jgi:N-acyl-D-aspartate/D-glutamate deacylase
MPLTADVFMILRAERRTGAQFGIQSGKIVQISPSRLTAQACLEADGLSVIPGLIDIHMHEDVLDNGAGGVDDCTDDVYAWGVTAALGGELWFFA